MRGAAGTSLRFVGGRHRLEGTDPQVRIPSPRVTTPLPPREKVGTGHALLVTHACAFGAVCPRRCHRLRQPIACTCPIRSDARTSASPLAEIGRVTTSDRQDEPILERARTRRTSSTAARSRASVRAPRRSDLAGAGRRHLSLRSIRRAERTFGIRGTHFGTDVSCSWTAADFAAARIGVVDLGSTLDCRCRTHRGRRRRRFHAVRQRCERRRHQHHHVDGGPTLVARRRRHLREPDRTAAQAGGGTPESSRSQRHIAANTYGYPAFSCAGGNATPAEPASTHDARQTVGASSRICGNSARAGARD